jgi:hypothetical protein
MGCPWKVFRCFHSTEIYKIRQPRAGINALAHHRIEVAAPGYVAVHRSWLRSVPEPQATILDNSRRQIPIRSRATPGAVLKITVFRRRVAHHGEHA